MKDDLAFNIKFIELIQERPCLYDSSRSDYSDRDSQHVAWMEIAEHLNESVADCKDRWRNLRGCYTRHLKKSSKPSGSSAKRVKPYYLAEQLQFLDGFTKTKRPKEVFLKLEQPEEERETTNETDDDTDNSHELYTPTPSIDDENYSTPKKVIKKNNYVSVKHENANAQSYFESKKLVSSKEIQDPDLSFFYSLLPDIKEMTSQQKRRFKIGTLKLIGDIFQSSSFTPNTSETYK